MLFDGWLVRLLQRWQQVWTGVDYQAVLAGEFPFRGFVCAAVKPMAIREKQQLGKRLKVVPDFLRSSHGLVYAAVKPMGIREKQQLGKRLKAVLDFLRSSRGNHSAADISAATNEDVKGDAQLAAAVASNAKIECASDGTYAYKV